MKTATTEITTDLEEFLSIEGLELDDFTQTRDTYENYVIDGPKTWASFNQIEDEEIGEGWRSTKITAVQAEKGQRRQDVTVLEIGTQVFVRIC